MNSRIRTFTLSEWVRRGIDQSIGVTDLVPSSLQELHILVEKRKAQSKWSVSPTPPMWVDAPRQTTTLDSASSPFDKEGFEEGFFLRHRGIERVARKHQLFGFLSRGR